uniref:GTPase-activating protein GYP7-like isoform X2 n=1 Tax=Tanacetum cinerariifolium TaxID=118510 RepID=A0A6L2K763_TANCI|nr:GTPase-activating protein GYP7-like isoform X2 [Tanacetum cinerariifolium]
MDKSHWFLCGLGPDLKTFCIAYQAVQPRPSFCYLVAQAESYELFISSLHGSTSSPVAFAAQHSTQPSRERGIDKSAWNKIRQRASPIEDLLLCAIAALVLQRQKQILEKYNSMDEIVRKCNNMEGQLDVWKLLDDAHDLVVSVHDKI